MPEVSQLSDHETAEAVRDGTLPSPTTYYDLDGNRAFDLFDLRITGTGAAWRESLGEYGIRDPALWTSPEFVTRCNGLMVIQDHPDGAGLNHEEFQQRAIGSIVLPYVKGDEVWGIAKIFDEDAALMMQTTHRSTSPGVTPPRGAKATPLESGAQVLDEGLPLVLDHLAVCAAGVWDKGGPAEGVRLDSALIGKGEVVTDEEKAALEKERDDARKDAADSKAELEKEREDRAKKDSERESEREEKERDDKAKKDAADAEAKEKADSAKRDSRKDRHAKHDAKKDGEIMDCARCDAEEKEEEKAEKEREDKAKKDAAKEVEVDPDRGTEEIKDSAKIASMEKQIADLMRAHRPLTIDEQDERSKAYHKYSGLFQMLMDTVKEPMPGEMPIAFRKRCSNALRRYTTSFKNYVFHDSQQLRDFELVEREIFDEATAYAKNPPHEDVVGQVRAIKDTQTLPGKVITTFVGDQHAVWAPFKAPTRLLKKVNHQPRGAAF